MKSDQHRRQGESEKLISFPNLMTSHSNNLKI